jgi:hypothetical protein
MGSEFAMRRVCSSLFALVLLAGICTGQSAFASQFHDATTHVSFTEPAKFQRILGEHFERISSQFRGGGKVIAAYYIPTTIESKRTLILLSTEDGMREHLADAQVEEAIRADFSGLKIRVWDGDDPIKLPPEGEGVFNSTFYRLIWRGKSDKFPDREVCALTRLGKDSTVTLSLACTSEHLDDCLKDFLAAAATVHFDKGYAYRTVVPHENRGMAAIAFQDYLIVIVVVIIAVFVVTQLLIFRARKKRRRRIASRSASTDLQF